MFRTWRRTFGYRWREQADDPKSRPTWLAALNALALNDAQVREGLRRSVALEWPPSPGEFAKLCRAIDCPDQFQGFAEAVRWVQSGRDIGAWRWSHPVIAAAVMAIGDRNWRSMTESELRGQWNYAYRAAYQRAVDGESLDIPPALPPPPKSRPASPETRARWLAEIRDQMAALGLPLRL